MVLPPHGNAGTVNPYHAAAAVAFALDFWTLCRYIFLSFFAASYRLDFADFTEAAKNRLFENKRKNGFVLALFFIFARHVAGKR